MLPPNHGSHEKNAGVDAVEDDIRCCGCDDGCTLLLP